MSVKKCLKCCRPHAGDVSCPPPVKVVPKTKPVFVTPREDFTTDSSGRALDPKTGKLLQQPARAAELGQRQELLGDGLTPRLMKPVSEREEVKKEVDEEFEEFPIEESIEEFGIENFPIEEVLDSLVEDLGEPELPPQLPEPELPQELPELEPEISELEKVWRSQFEGEVEND